MTPDHPQSRRLGLISESQKQKLSSAVCFWGGPGHTTLTSLWLGGLTDNKNASYLTKLLEGIKVASRTKDTHVVQNLLHCSEHGSQ